MMEEEEESLEATLCSLKKTIDTLASTISTKFGQDGRTSPPPPPPPPRPSEAFHDVDESCARMHWKKDDHKPFFNPGKTSSSTAAKNGGNDLTEKSYSTLKQLALEVNFLHSNLYYSQARLENGLKRHDLMLEEVMNNIRRIMADMKERKKE
nr:uncharacterized protein LOC113804911 [Penaeus vannamei]